METSAEFLTRRDGVRLAYRYLPGRGPTIVFLPGYMSDMQGSKAAALAQWAIHEGHSMLRLDYSGCGESGGVFADGTLDIWRDDVIGIIQAAVTGPVIIVGSSMGGWLMLLVALALGPQVTGLVGIAAAPDFTDWDMDENDRAAIIEQGKLLRPSEYGYDSMIITHGFWLSGQANRLLGTDIAIDCPVRLMHGQNDPDVPWEISVRLAAALRSSDVQTLLIKDGDHRLSRDQDIKLLIECVADLIV